MSNNFKGDIMEYHIGGRIRCLANRIRRKTENIEVIMRLQELSGTNGFIIGYLHRAKTPVYQKDLEQEFGITRSTASKVLSLMEKKGLIERRAVDRDARLKQIVLTPKAIELNKEVVHELNLFEKQLLNSFTEEEVQLLSSYLKRIEDNLYMEGE